MSKQYKSFWVIFDTGFKPPYYQDVHNILAMPHGSIVRYNYSEKYLSKEAVEFAKVFPNAPAKLLLAYCQYAGFKRGDDRSKFTSSDQKIWTPTRLAEIVHIQVSAENYYFDIKLLDFPYLVKEAKNQIFSELQQKKEIPFDLLVMISSRHNELENLEERADKDTNWDSIVNWFQQEDTQFKDDSFWHLRGPYDASNNALLSQSYEHDEVNAGNNKKVLHKNSYFSVHNQQELWFEVINREPRNYLTKHTNTGVIAIRFGLALSYLG
jgi:hypothetical protein